MSLILETDSYKASHFLQYPPGTEFISSYIEARGGDYPEIPFFGLTPILEKFKTLLYNTDVAEAEALFAIHGVPFNGDGWRKMIEIYDGNLPVEIQALKEGTVVSPGVPMLQIKNTDPRFPWLTSYLETMLVRGIWYPTTVCTISRFCKQVISTWLNVTADNPDAELPFKLHDFGARGASSAETAMLGGMAHLVNFMGTDTVEALVGARRFYGEPCAGFSIPASEHSTITSWTEDKECEAHANMIDTFMNTGSGKSGMVASVSDSYNIYRCCDNIWCGALKDKVQRYGERGGVLVVRPDSGDPLNLTYGTVTRLMDGFGATTNTKGYKVLPSYVRIIQGDGVNPESINAILNNFMLNKISASNIAFGMGGALLQKCDRDTLKFAMKANEITVNGETRDVYKAPIHDAGKVSKKGRQAVIVDPVTGKYEAVREDALGHRKNELELVYKNGMFFRHREKFADIRARAALKPMTLAAAA